MGLAGLLRWEDIAGVRWRPVLALGSGVGVFTQLLLYPIIFGYALSLSLLLEAGLVGRDGLVEQAEWFGTTTAVWGLPAIQMLLLALATSWVARRAGIAAAGAVLGVAMALVSVATGQIFGLVYGPLDAGETARYVALALLGALIGAAEARGALAGQEALHGASRQLGEAHSPQAVINAVGENPLSPAVCGAALWWSGSPAEGEDSTRPPGKVPEAWTPWFLRGWPEGLRFDGLDVPTLAGHGRGTYRVLRARELPTVERAAWREGGVRSALLVPLVSPAGRGIGLLAVASREGRFSRSVVRSYVTAGAQAALALENLRLVEEARKAGRQAGVLRERQRMAHEIHDTLAQGFISIVTNLEAAEGAMHHREPDDDDAAVRHHLDHARLTARESLTEARRLVWALRPEALAEAPLPEALARLAERWSGASGIEATVETTGEARPLAPQVEATLYRVAQEALANARKHAKGASRVALTLSYIGETVALDARDDGAGFDPLRGGRRRDKSSGGFGLKGMRERVEGVGGSLSVESAPGEGTTLAVELPVVANEISEPESSEDETLDAGSSRAGNDVVEEVV